MNAGNFLKFLQDTKGRKVPFVYKLKYAPETLTKEDLHIKGDFELQGINIESLPDNLTIDGDFYLYNTMVGSLPNNLRIKGDLFMDSNPISNEHNRTQIRRMIEEFGGYVRGGIYV